MAVVELTDDTFEKAVTDNGFVIVDFWAPWCGPCKSFAPTYEKVSEDHEDIVFAKVNTEEQQQVAAHFQIRSIPTLMIFRDQIIIFSQAGALPEGAFRELLQKASELDMDEVRKQIEQEQAGNA
ncbi:MAG: thioredoxin [Gammaproteobacteria bacterium]